MANKASFFSILVGLAAGAAIGVLYAPDKGWKTRARVKRAAANGYDDLKDGLNDLGTKVDEKSAEAKESLKTLRDTLREKAGEIKEGTRSLLMDQLDRLEGALEAEEAAAEEAFGEEAEEAEETEETDEQ